MMDRIGAARRVTDKGVSWSVGKTPSGREAVYDFDRATKVVGQPIPMSRSQAGVHRPPPKLGQHTDEMPAEAGFRLPTSPRCARRGDLKQTSLAGSTYATEPMPAHAGSNRTGWPCRLPPWPMRDVVCHRGKALLNEGGRVH